jgi:hypothetical protein
MDNSPTWPVGALSPGLKGAIAETAVAHRCIRLGIGVYRPVFEGGRYDLVLDVQGRLLRVQSKWAPLDGSVVVVRCYSTTRAREGSRVTTYKGCEVDVIAAFCPQLDRVYMIPPILFERRKTILLRTVVGRKNQRERVNWADDYALESLHWVRCTGP